jgi:hypothetical protein
MDIVERLREVPHQFSEESIFAKRLRRQRERVEAADEIERLREALNIFMAVDPDKPSNWLYKREKAEALVKESLSTGKQFLQVWPWKCPIGKTDCNENCGSYGCGN